MLFYHLFYSVDGSWNVQPKYKWFYYSLPSCLVKPIMFNLLYILLAIEKFNSSMMGKKKSNKEYELVLKVWDKIEMKTVKDYHNL